MQNRKIYSGEAPSVWAAASSFSGLRPAMITSAPAALGHAGDFKADGARAADDGDDAADQRAGVGFVGFIIVGLGKHAVFVLGWV
jgi:hypothetical protein